MGSPIQTSPDHRIVAASPKLFAGSHVFHRLWLPRHPPCALHYLTIQPQTVVLKSNCYLKASIQSLVDWTTYSFNGYLTKTLDSVLGASPLYDGDAQLTTTQFFQSIKESLSLRQVRDIQQFLNTTVSINQQRLVSATKLCWLLNFHSDFRFSNHLENGGV